MTARVDRRRSAVEIPHRHQPSSTHAHSTVGAVFDRFACVVTRWAGSPYAFSAALLCVVGWACLGRFFDFSETWQLVINTGTTIVTFLMVFLIQQSQNKDSVALHLKINELIAANRQASNKMIGVEELDEEDLRDLAAHYTRLAEQVGQEAGDSAPDDER